MITIMDLDQGFQWILIPDSKMYMTNQNKGPRQRIQARELCGDATGAYGGSTKADRHRNGKGLQVR